MQNATEDDLAYVRSAGFSTILSYKFGPTGLPQDGSMTEPLPRVKAFLDAAHAHDLRVFYAMNGFFDFDPYDQPHGLNWTKAVVSTFKDHPAIAAWYTVDELPLQRLPDLKARRQLVRRLDPTHVTYGVLNHAPQIAQYVDVAETLGVDPYPYEGDPSLGRSNLTKALRDFEYLQGSIAHRADRASVCVSQYFGWQNYGSGASYTLPPFAAMRSMAFASFASGCKGLLLYSYYDLLMTTSPRNTPPDDRNRASPEVVAARLLELKLLGREVAALAEVLVQPVYNEHIQLAPGTPRSVASGLRCPAAQKEACTLILANLAPEPVVVRASIAQWPGFAQRLAPYGATITSVPRPATVA